MAVFVTYFYSGLLFPLLWSRMVGVALAQSPLCPLAAFSGSLKTELNSKNCLNYLWTKFNQMLSQLIFVDLHLKYIHYSDLWAVMINISFIRLFSCWVILKQLFMRLYLHILYRATVMFMKLPWNRKLVQLIAWYNSKIPVGITKCY